MKRWTFHVTSCPIDVPALYHVEGELRRDGFFPDHDDLLCRACGGTGDGEHDPVEGTLMCVACNGTGQQSFVGSDVRVRYRFAIADKAALNVDLVTAPFVGARRIVPDPVPTHTRAIRAPEIVEAPTEEAKVRAFVAGGGTTWTPGLDQKFAMLQLPDGATFLNQLEVDLTGTPVEADAPPERPMEVFQ